MSKKFWQFRDQAGNRAELLLYGDIADTTWWGDEVTPNQFAGELRALGAVEEITVRVNSGGGDVFAAQAIGNLLEQHPARVTARIDGLCASAATVIACHCDRVVAAEDSTYMIHPVKRGVCGYVDTVQMQQYLDACRVITENIVNLYAKKTGRKKEEVTEWMNATSWWTAKDARDNGFVDEVADSETPVEVENRNGVLFVNRVSMGVPFAKAPESVQNRLAGHGGCFVDHTPEGEKDENEENKEEEEVEIKTVDELRRAYPELTEQVEQAAVNAERERIRDIEEMTVVGSEKLAHDAKFTKPVTAADFAKAAMKQVKERGAGYLNALRKDTDVSGVNGVEQSQPHPQSEGKPHREDEFLNALQHLSGK